MGHHYMGHNYMGHNYMGHNYMCLHGVERAPQEVSLALRRLERRLEAVGRRRRLRGLEDHHLGVGVRRRVLRLLLPHLPRTDACAGVRPGRGAASLALDRSI